MHCNTSCHKTYTNAQKDDVALWHCRLGYASLSIWDIFLLYNCHCQFFKKIVRMSHLANGKQTKSPCKIQACQ